MWWGGGEPPDKDEGHMPDEEAQARDPGNDGTSSAHQVEQELYNLQEQLASQQQLIGNLKSKLPQSGTSHEDYATRLAAMRSRLSRPQQKHAKPPPKQQQGESESFHTESVSVDPSVTPFEVVHHDSDSSDFAGGARFGGSMMDISSSAGPDPAAAPSVSDDGSVTKKARTASFSEGTSSSKIQLLRKQLDQNRSKFEKQQRENREKKANMDEMKKKMEKLRSELEQRDQFIQSFEKGMIPEHSQPTMQQLCQQLLQKDTIVQGLSARVSELERLSQDQKEQLEEKNCIIDARTEAVALVTKDRDEKLLKMMEDLEERQSNMRLMQEDFTTREEEWRSHRDSLQKLLSEKAGRVTQLEENGRRIEGIRFELSTRAAELQEKVVALQSERSEIMTQLAAERTKSLDAQSLAKELKQKLCKAEAHGRNKLKNLEKQVKSMKQENGQDVGQQILELHNQIAVLEEEKGNLQLRLVDFDDFKSSNSTLEQEASALHKKVEEMNKNLDLQSSSISALGNEKIKLVEVLNDRELKLFDLESNIVKFEEENQEMSKNKISQEKEMEELHDQLKSSSTQCESLLLQLQQEQREREDNGVEVILAEEKSKLEETVSGLTEQLNALKEQYNKRDEETRRYKELCEQAESSQLETSEANQRLLSILTDKEDSLTNQSIEIDKANALISDHCSKIEQLDSCVEMLKQERDQITSKYQLELDDVRELLTGKERELDELNEAHKEEAVRLSEATEEATKLRGRLGGLQDALNETEDELANSRDHNSRLNKMVHDHEKTLKSLKKETNSLKRLLEDETTGRSELAESVSNLKSALSSVEADKSKLEKMMGEAEKNLAVKTKEIEKLHKDFMNCKQNFEDCQEDLHKRANEIVRLTGEKEALAQQMQQQIDQLQNNLSSVQNDLHERTQSNEVLEQRCREWQASLEATQKELCDKCEKLNEYENEVSRLTQEIAAKDECVAQLHNAVSQATTDAEEHKRRCQESNESLRNNEVSLTDALEQIESIKDELSTCANELVSKDEMLTDLNNRLAYSEAALRSSDEKFAHVMSDTKTSLESTLNAERQLWTESAERDILHKQSELDSLNQRLSENVAEMATLRLKLSEREANLIEADDKIKNSANEFEKLRSEYDSLTHLYNQSNASATALQQQISLSADELEHWKCQYQERDDKILSLEHRIDALLIDVQEKENTIKLKEERLEEKASEFGENDSEKQEKIDQLTGELSLLRPEYEALKVYSEQQAHYQTQCEAWSITVQEEKTALLEQIDVTKAQLENGTHELQQKIEELQEVSQTNLTLNETVGRLQAEVTKNEANLQQAIAQKQDLELKLEQQLMELTQLQSIRSSEANKLIELGENVRHIESELSIFNIRNGELSEKLAAEMRVAEDLREQLKVSRDLGSSLGHRVSAEHLQQKASLSASGSRSSSRQSEHSDEQQQQQQAAQCRALQAQLDEALLKITQLETSLGTCSRDGREREAADGDESLFGEVDLRDSLSGSPSGATSPEVLRLQQTLAEKSQLVEQMQEQLSTLKQTLHSRQEEMALLSVSKQSFEEKYSDLLSSNQLLHDLLHHQTREADEVSSRLVSVLAELASLKAQIKSVEAVHLQHLQDQLQVQYEQYQKDVNEKYAIMQSLNIQVAEQQSRIQELERSEEQKVSYQTASTESAPFTAGPSSDVTHGAVPKDISSLFSSPAAEASDCVDWFKSETKETLGQFPQTQTTEQTTPPQELSGMPPSEQQPVDQVADLQYKLSWYEEQWSNWTSHCAVLEQSYNEAQAQILHLTGLLGAKNAPDGSPPTCPSGVEITTDTSSVGASSPDISSDQPFLQPTQVSESTSQTVHGGPPTVETVASVGVDPTDASGEGSQLHSDQQRLLQELLEARQELLEARQELDQLKLRLVKETELQTQLRDAENTVQLLQTERQTLQHQSSSGGSSGGGSGRVAELELIVESAETEIARLRGQLHQQQEERERLVAHGVALETKLAGGDGAREVEQQLRDVEKQLNMAQRENDTLRSELEVMEGENSRRSTDIEILESENNRLRTDLEMATQSSQILEAEKESLIMEIQRLEQERERIGSEMSDIDASREAANDQIRSLHQQLVSAQQQMAESRPLQQTSADTSELAEEELDWGSEGTKELEHFQRSSSFDAPLKEEVQALKKQLIDAEKERNSLSDELQGSKVKCGKLLQKLKSAQNKNEALQKDVERLKSMKGGLSDLDQALEDEYKAQVMQAQSETDELKQRLEDVVKEKDHSSRQCEVLRDAHDRFVELKEDQDAQIRVLKSRNKELESAVSSMEWKISELEETVQEQQSSGDGRSSSSSPTASIQAKQSAGAGSMSMEHVKNLTDQIIALESQLDEMSSSNMKIESLNKDLNERVSELEAANESLRQEKVLLESEVAQFRIERDKASKDVSVYKEAFIQQQEQFEKLTDEKSALDRELDKAEYQRNTLNSEYNAFYEELVEMRKDHAALKYEYSILAGERDRLSDDIEVLTAELEAFRHDRLEDTVRALEEEITSLRNTCTALKEEATEHGAQQAAVHDELERLQCDLQYSRNEQEDLREKIRLQTEEERLNNSEMERLERRLKYSDAELGAITSRNKQLMQEAAVASNEAATLQEQVRHWTQQSQHLSRQVESADASLVRLSEAGVEAAQGGGTELEAALASLHLRDLRCHHLIMEINKLVEERDSLQLRLSSALRNNQEMQRRYSVGEQQQKETEAGSQPRGAEATVAAAVQKRLTPPLHTKLSELRELSNEVQQKTLASLPPSPFSSHTAPNSPSSGIITPEYTLTRETQATSSTLINWIMGRTTPRVMHI